MVKAFNFPIETVLYDISYPNVVLYCATLPTYEGSSKKEAEKELHINDKARQQEIDRFINSFD